MFASKRRQWYRHKSSPCFGSTDGTFQTFCPDRGKTRHYALVCWHCQGCRKFSKGHNITRFECALSHWPLKCQVLIQRVPGVAGVWDLQWSRRGPCRGRCFLVVCWTVVLEDASLRSPVGLFPRHIAMDGAPCTLGSAPDVSTPVQLAKLGYAFGEEHLCTMFSSRVF